jgi:hypothetical protein
MKAAAHFTYGDGKESYEFSPGDDVPDKIANDVPSHLILERLAKSDPASMTKDQLMQLAGVGPWSEDSGDTTEAEPAMTEESLREAFANFRTKADLVDWFAEVRPDSEYEVSTDMTRDDIEDTIIVEFLGEDETT